MENDKSNPAITSGQYCILTVAENEKKDMFNKGSVKK